MYNNEFQFRLADSFGGSFGEERWSLRHKLGRNLLLQGVFMINSTQNASNQPYTTTTNFL